MIAFIIAVNGVRISTVELSSENTRLVNLSWIGNTEQEVFLKVGGMEGDDHLTWSMPQLKVGDEVTIKIMESTTSDPPSTRKTAQELERWTRSLRPKK